MLMISILLHFLINYDFCLMSENCCLPFSLCFLSKGSNYVFTLNYSSSSDHIFTLLREAFSNFPEKTWSLCYISLEHFKHRLPYLLQFTATHAVWLFAKYLPSSRFFPLLIRIYLCLPLYHWVKYSLLHRNWMSKWIELANVCHCIPWKSDTEKVLSFHILQVLELNNLSWGNEVKLKLLPHVCSRVHSKWEDKI